jgi:hypothetical protein
MANTTDWHWGCSPAKQRSCLSKVIAWSVLLIRAKVTANVTDEQLNMRIFK